MNHADLRRTEVCVHVVRVCREARAPLLLASSIKAALDRDWSDQAEKASAVKSLVIELENLKDWLVANLAEELKKPPLSDQVRTLKQLMAQDLEPDPGGGGIKIREGVAEDRRVSIEDAEMRHGRKSKTKRFNGYKRHIATDLDSGLILSGAITPANRPSGRGSRAQPGRRHHPAGVRDRRALHRPRLREVPARRRGPRPRRRDCVQALPREAGRESVQVTVIAPKLGVAHLVGATGLEPATTCTPTMPSEDTSVSTGRTESQGLGIAEAQDRAFAPPDAPAAPLVMGNGAHMGRGKLPDSEVIAGALKKLGRRVAEAIARGEFDRARALTEEAIRIRGGEPSSSGGDASRGAPE